MKENESVEYVTAFVIGAVIGAGAALLLKPDPPTRTERVLRELQPVAKRARKVARSAGHSYGKSLKQGRKATDELSKAGRELIEDFSDRVESILSEAAEELAEGARDQYGRARKSMKRRLRRFRS